MQLRDPGIFDHLSQSEHQPEYRIPQRPRRQTVPQDSPTPGHTGTEISPSLLAKILRISSISPVFSPFAVGSIHRPTSSMETRRTEPGAASSEEERSKGKPTRLQPFREKKMKQKHGRSSNCWEKELECPIEGEIKRHGRISDIRGREEVVSAVSEPTIDPTRLPLYPAPSAHPHHTMIFATKSDKLTLLSRQASRRISPRRRDRNDSIRSAYSSFCISGPGRRDLTSRYKARRRYPRGNSSWSPGRRACSLWAPNELSLRAHATSSVKGE